MNFLGRAEMDLTIIVIVTIAIIVIVTIAIIVIVTIAIMLVRVGQQGIYPADGTRA
jgi:hypothetical protein